MTAAEPLGHARLETTRVYTRPSAEDAAAEDRCWLSTSSRTFTLGPVPAPLSGDYGSFVIRRADRTEANALAALYRSSILAHCTGAYTRDQIEAWIAPLQRRAYSAMIGEAAVLVSVDESDTKLLGVGVCSPGQGLINAVYVAPGVTGRGIGSRLMRSLEAVLRESNAPEARLNATLNAVGFYRSLGYRNESSTVNVLPSGVELPCVAMSKPLQHGRWRQSW